MPPNRFEPSPEGAKHLAQGKTLCICKDFGTVFAAHIISV